MRKLLIVALLSPGAAAIAQVKAPQSAAPIAIQPRDSRPTLLVVCDLPCNWKLDGEAKGRIEAEGSAKAKVELGEHLVVAVTEDGLDQFKVIKEVKSTGQTVLDIELKPIRDKRVSAAKPVEAETGLLLVTCDLACTWTLDGEAKGRIDAGGSVKAQIAAGPHKVVAVTEDGKDTVSTSVDGKAGAQTLVSLALQPVRDARNKKRQDQDKGAQAAVTGLVWTDPATQLTWATKDNGKNVTWKQATDYCRSLAVADLAEWRLPTIDELKTAYEPTVDTPGIDETGSAVPMHVKGNLHLTGWQWSQSQANISGEAWGFSFATGKRLAGRFTDNLGNRALCVRGPGSQ